MTKKNKDYIKTSEELNLIKIKLQNSEFNYLVRDLKELIKEVKNMESKYNKIHKIDKKFKDKYKLSDRDLFQLYCYWVDEFSLSKQDLKVQVEKTLIFKLISNNNNKIIDKFLRDYYKKNIVMFN